MSSALSASVEAIATCIGTFAQIVIAIIVYRYTHKSTKANSIKLLNEMNNNYNALQGSTPAHIAAMTGIRNPIVDVVTDSLMFSYINVTRVHCAMRKEGLITEDAENVQLRNLAHMLYALDQNKFEKYLGRGYEKEFVDKVKLEVQHIRKEKKAQGAYE